MRFSFFSRVLMAVMVVYRLLPEEKLVHNDHLKTAM